MQAATAPVRRSKRVYVTRPLNPVLQHIISRERTDSFHERYTEMEKMIAFVNSAN
jgi:hypothetical protein